MLAKDGAGETVKVARGLHDLSEMEGVKINVAVDKGNVYFLQVIIRTNVDNLYLFLIFLCFPRLVRTSTSPSWCSALTPWIRCSMTRTTIRNF